MVHKDRNGSTVDTLILGVFNSFVEVQHYENAMDQFLVYNEFEANTWWRLRIYSKHSVNLMLDNTFCNYVNIMRSMMEDENKRRASDSYMEVAI